MARGEGFSVHVKTFSGQTAVVEGVLGNDTVEEIKEKVGKVVGSPPGLLRLFYKGNSLDDEAKALRRERVAAELDLKPGSVRVSTHLSLNLIV